MKSALILLVSIFFLLLTNASGQNTKIFGKVTDAKTGEVLPFVNVYFTGTQVGTTTDLDGKFLLETNLKVDSISARFVGYEISTKAVEKNKAQTINFSLTTGSVELQEIVIKPGVNPAEILLKKIIENKGKNDKEQLDYYSYEVYNKVEFDLNNIDEEFRNKKVFKQFEFIFDNIDSSDAKPYLPMFMTESISDFHYRKQPKSEREIIKGVKVSGLQNESVNQFLGDMYQKVNIYDNYVLVFGKSFVSPIADFGLRYYKYYMVDSAYIDNHWAYKVTFMPRRRQEPTFAGQFWVADTSFALMNVEVSIASDANINFIKGFMAEQDYRQIDSVWMLTRDKLVVDFNLSNKAMGIYGRKTTTYKDFRLNQIPPDTVFAGVDKVVVLESSNQRDEEFWDSSRHDSLTENEKAIYTMIDSMKNIPRFRTYVDLITMFMTGYKVIGKFEFGPYFTTYSFNQVEGHRFRLGGRTSNSFSKRLMIEAYGAYGLKDETFKYGGGIQYFLSKKPRFKFIAHYKYDMEQLGQSVNALRQDNILASAFRRNPFDKLTLVEEYKTSLEREWLTGFSNRITLSHRTLQPRGSLEYLQLNSEGAIENLSSITTSEVSLYTRFAYKEKYVEGEFDRISLGTKYPTVQLDISFGIPDLIGSDYEYQRIKLNVSGDFRTRPFGYIEYIFEGGKILGSAPYPLLELHNGNETYFYDHYAFNMMNYFEFASDQYVSASLTQHFNGFFFNRVPLFRRLKWREVVFGKAVTGTLDAKNALILVLPENMTSLEEPYVEVGAGVENIFKIFRVDGLWRLTHLDRPNVNQFGIRGTFAINF